MRSVTLLLAAVVIAVASVTVRACEGSFDLTFNSILGGYAVPLDTGLSEGDTLRMCLAVDASKRLDFYFVAKNDAEAWQTGANNYYFATTRTTPYAVAPSNILDSRLGTNGFSVEFDISAQQAAIASANGGYAVIYHSTSDCLGTGNSCSMRGSVLKITPANPVVIIVLVCVGVVLLILIGVCVYCCCCRNKNPPESVEGQAQTSGAVVPDQQAPQAADENKQV